MIETNDSSSHAYDGVDIDTPETRPLSREGWYWALHAREDLKELKEMSEADKAHYASTPGGSRHTSISRGR